MEVLAVLLQPEPDHRRQGTEEKTRECVCYTDSPLFNFVGNKRWPDRVGDGRIKKELFIRGTMQCSLTTLTYDGRRCYPDW